MFHLIDGWKASWRLSSVQINAIGTAFLATWVLMPREQQDALLALVGLTPSTLPALAGIVFLASGIYARLVAQPKTAAKIEEAAIKADVERMDAASE